MDSISIAIVMFYTNLPKRYKFADSIEAINRKYCEVNKYDFFVYNIIPETLKNRHPAWCKHFYILKHLVEGQHDYIMWIDADAFFCNHSIRIEEWIKKASPKDNIIARDAGHSLQNFYIHLLSRRGLPLINSGVMIFKTTEDNIKLLNHILYDPIYIPNYSHKRTSNPKTGIVGWDQAAVRDCYRKNINNMKTNTWICMDLNLNNNCEAENLEDYIKNGGFIIHLTNFRAKFKPKNMKTIRKYRELTELQV